MIGRGSEAAAQVGGRPSRVVRLQEKIRILEPAGDAEQLARDPLGPVELAPGQVEQPHADQGRRQVGRELQPARDRARPLERFPHLPGGPAVQAHQRRTELAEDRELGAGAFGDLRQQAVLEGIAEVLARLAIGRPEHRLLACPPPIDDRLLGQPRASAMVREQLQLAERDDRRALSIAATIRPCRICRRLRSRLS